MDAATIENAMKSNLLNSSDVFVDSLGTSHTALHATIFPLWLMPKSIISEHMALGSEQAIVDFLRSKGMRCSVSVCELGCQNVSHNKLML